MIRNYIRKQLWRVVLAAARYDEHLGLTALKIFAKVYFIIERPYVGPAPSFDKSRVWDEKRAAYFRGEKNANKAVIPTCNIQESLYEGVR